MSDINLQLVRECFELNRFSVLTHWRHPDERARGGEGAALLFVERSGGEESGPAPFLLHGGDLRFVDPEGGGAEVRLLLPSALASGQSDTKGSTQD